VLSLEFNPGYGLQNYMGFCFDRISGATTSQSHPTTQGV